MSHWQSQSSRTSPPRLKKLPWLKQESGRRSAGGGGDGIGGDGGGGKGEGGNAGHGSLALISASPIQDPEWDKGNCTSLLLLRPASEDVVIWSFDRGAVVPGS